MISVTSSQLNSLIHDYLIRSGLYNTANIFLMESELQLESLNCRLEELIMLGARCSFIEQHNKQLTPNNNSLDDNSLEKLIKHCSSDFTIGREHFCSSGLKFLDLYSNTLFTKVLAFNFENRNFFLLSDDLGNLKFFSYTVKNSKNIKFEILAEHFVYEKICKLEVLEQLKILIVGCFNGKVYVFNLNFLLFQEVKPEIYGIFSEPKKRLEILEFPQNKFPSQAIYELELEKGPVMSVTYSSNRLMLGTITGEVVQVVLQNLKKYEPGEKEKILEELKFECVKSAIKLTESAILSLCHLNKSLLAAGTKDGSVIFFNLKTKEIDVYKKQSAEITKLLKISNTNKIIRLVSSSMDGKLILWEVTDEKVTKTENFELHANGITDFIYDALNEKIITVGLDGVMNFVCAQSLTCKKRIEFQSPVIKMRRYENFVALQGEENVWLLCLEDFKVYNVNKKYKDMSIGEIVVNVKDCEDFGVELVDYSFLFG